MKKALLVFGCSERDTLEYAKKLQVEREENSNTIWRIVSEQSVLQDYVKDYDYNDLCLKEWMNPIKNAVIVSLLHRTEREINNRLVKGVIVCGQFALDEDVRQAYQEILVEQGYEVELFPIMTMWVSLLNECLTNRTSVRKALKNWRSYSRQFTRQYTPFCEKQQKAVVVSSELATKKDIPGTFEIVVMLEALYARGYAILVIDTSRDVVAIKEAFKNIGFPTAEVFYPNSETWGNIWFDEAKANFKISLFWTAIANYYDVKLVVEHSALAIPKWRDIGLPVISLTDIFDVEYIV